MRLLNISQKAVFVPHQFMFNLNANNFISIRFLDTKLIFFELVYMLSVHYFKWLRSVNLVSVGQNAPV